MLSRLEGFEFVGISEAMLTIDEFANSNYPYEQGLIKVIRNNASYAISNQLEYLSTTEHPIKFEGYERLNPVMFRESKRLGDHLGHNGFVSCHVFISPKDSQSFGIHTDPDDVVLYMVKGRKVFEHPEGTVELNEGQTLVIPRNYPHRAINTDDSIMLSFGLELFLEQKLWV